MSASLLRRLLLPYALQLRDGYGMLSLDGSETLALRTPATHQAGKISGTSQYFAGASMETMWCGGRGKTRAHRGARSDRRHLTTTAS